MISENRSKELAAGVIALVAVAFSPLILTPTHTQVVGATLFGTVTDQSGPVMPNTQISIKNITGEDAAGFYTVPNLLPGSYEITATARENPICAEVGLVVPNLSVRRLNGRTSEETLSD
jgi:hypothetical protein